MIDQILRQEIFKTQPPVLVDVGASGGIHARWKSIAKYAHCVAFDADDREMKVTENSASGFRRMATINRIVTDKEESEIDFYLTASPYCSSTLEPDMTALSKWPFQSLFAVEKKVRLKAVRLADALKNAGVTYIDWLKIDTQGTDLQIFRSLPADIQKKILVAEFEPGIIDAYKGENKLHEVIRYMQDGFFLSTMEVRSVPRIDAGIVSKFSKISQRALRTSHKAAPGWAEVTFMNQLLAPADSRAYQLLFVFALVEKQFGFAAEIAQRGRAATGDPFFDELHRYALDRLSGSRYRWPFIALRNRFVRAFDAMFH